MSKGRMEAFSDGVLAIIITIMVLGLHVPQGSDFAALVPLAPVFISYVLSFAILAIYWNNHHHLLQAADRVDGRVLWANVHLLFWLSLVPAATSWLGEHPFQPWPVAIYGLLMLFAAIAYFILTRTLMALHGHGSHIVRAVGRDWKGKMSVAAYLVAVAVSFRQPKLAYSVYVAVGVMWLVPDRRIERTLKARNE